MRILIEFDVKDERIIIIGSIFFYRFLSFFNFSPDVSY